MSRLIMWQGAIAGVMAVAALAFIGWGVTSDNELLLAFGGALFGASIEKILTLLTNKDFGDSMIDVLTKSLHSTVRSSEADARHFRRVLYFYHPTSIGGNLAWRCDTLDFGHDISPGSLTAVCEVSTKADPRPLRFAVSAFVRGKRVVLVRQPEDRPEDPSIAVLPHLAEYHRYDSGILFKQTWDGGYVASPCILSFQLLATPIGEGFVGVADYDKLQQLWTQQFSALNKGCEVQFGWK